MTRVEVIGVFCAGFATGWLLARQEYKRFVGPRTALLEESRRIGYEEGWAAASNFGPHIAMRYKELYGE